MANQQLIDLTALDISSVTNTDSLFLYVVNNGAARRAPARAFNSSVLGGIKQFATVSRPSIDLTKNVYHVMSWTITVSDTYSLLDPSSGTLFRIPDNTLTHAQVMVQGEWENYLGTNGPSELRIHGAGLPESYPTTTGFEDWTPTTFVIHQAITPVMKVQSGSYFYVDVKHRHSVNRFFEGLGRNFFSIWCW